MLDPATASHLDNPHLLPTVRGARLSRGKKREAQTQMQSVTISMTIKPYGYHPPAAGFFIRTWGAISA
jgi:hypothetical protein